MEFFTKITENPYADLYWNIPEENKQGTIGVLGGSAQNFRTPISVAEYLNNNFPLKETRVVLPENLKTKLPTLDNFLFLKSTDVGSYLDAEEIKNAVDSVDAALIIGDLAKNSITRNALASALKDSAKPLLITRDAVDLMAESNLAQILMRENLTIFASTVQWQKIFKNLYYPKILQPSQSLVQVSEAFHKFTLSYPVQMISLHNGQIILAKNGKVIVVPIEKSHYTMLTIWNGELAGKILAMNLFNPERFIEASVAAIFK